MARPPRRGERLWGSLPIEEVEGHDVDPAYDVRPVEGLGRPPVRSESLARMRSESMTSGLGKLPLFLQDVAPEEPEPTPSSPNLFGISTPYIVLAAVGAVALGMFLKRR